MFCIRGFLRACCTNSPTPHSVRQKQVNRVHQLSIKTERKKSNQTFPSWLFASKYFLLWLTTTSKKISVRGFLSKSTYRKTNNRAVYFTNPPSSRYHCHCSEKQATLYTIDFFVTHTHTYTHSHIKCNSFLKRNRTD